MLQTAPPHRSAALPYTGRVLFHAAECTPRWREFRGLEDATALHYRNSGDYDYYQGVDLEPDHRPWPVDGARQYFSAGIDFSSGGMKNASLASGRLQVGECTAPSTDGEVNGTWHTQWVGPFTTHGGYDWTTVSWVDPAFIMRGRRRGESVGLAAHWMGPVDVQRKQALGLPPLHLHHVHMTASPDDTFLSPFFQWHHGRVIMTHGDWNFDGMPGEENGTVDAMGQDYRPAKVLKVLSDRPSINVEVNDVRPAGSPPLQWYFQVTVLVVDNLDDARAAGHRPLSSIKTQAPDGEGMLVGGQTGLVFPYFAPRTEDTMMYHSIRMPEDGEMVHVYFHAHQRTHQATLLFGGPPSALGLDAIAAAGRHVSVLPTQVYTNTTGVAKNNVQMRSLLEERSHVRGVPLVCTMEGRVQRLSGYGFTTPKAWDRAAYPSCIRWSFSKGEVMAARGSCQTNDFLSDAAVAACRSSHLWHSTGRSTSTFLNQMSSGTASASACPVRWRSIPFTFSSTSPRTSRRARIHPRLGITFSAIAMALAILKCNASPIKCTLLTSRLLFIGRKAPCFS